MRIVSLLPSATEIICALGLRDQLVGISHSCDFPSDVAGLPVVTETVIDDEKSPREIDGDVRDRLGSADALYTLKMDELRALEPDLIVTQDLCDVCAVSAGDVQSALATLPGAPRVVNMEPQSFGDVFGTIAQTAQAAGAPAEPLVSNLATRIDAVRKRTEASVKSADRPRVAFIEWLDPPFQGGHWMPELIESAGGIDLLGVPHQHSSTITWQQVRDAEPDLIFVSCCGFPVERTLTDLEAIERQPFWQELVAGADRGVFVSDGNAYFARPGPRLVESLEIMAHACHPDLHPRTAAVETGLTRIA